MSFIPRALTLIILSILPAFVCFSEQTAPLQEKVINLHDIDKLLYRGNGILIIEQGPIPKVILDGSADEVANTSIVLTDHTLVVKEKRGFLDFFRSRPSTIKCTVVLEDLVSFTLEGDANVRMHKFKANDLELVIRDNAELHIQVEANGLSTFLIRDAEIFLDGRVGNQRVLISNGGLYRAKDLKSEGAQITIEGSGMAYVSVTNNLDVTITNNGIVSYNGTPKKIQSHITGSGQLIEE